MQYIVHACMTVSIIESAKVLLVCIVLCELIFVFKLHRMSPTQVSSIDVQCTDYTEKENSLLHFLL